MAYTQKAKTNTEHPFRTIVKLMDSGALPRVLLCHGHEEFLVNWAERYVRGKLLRPARAARPRQAATRRFAGKNDKTIY
ncbi:MAG: hypothetical protein K5981_07360 [Clostridia bacterium]|nr:hypothetical protein [Clostridia bacterium]